MRGHNIQQADDVSQNAKAKVSNDVSTMHAEDNSAG